MSAGRGLTRVLAILALSTAAARAQDFEACIKQSGGVSTRMLECGAQEIARWDARLNAAYRTVLAHATPAGRTSLRAAQRAWLEHHRAETRRLAGAADGGSMAFLDSQVFELSDLQQRTEVLEQRAKLSGPPTPARP